MNVDCIIKGGIVVLPGKDTVRCDVLIKDGTVVDLALDHDTSADRVIDATGLHVLPGLIDPHVHLDVIYPKIDQLHHETRSALRGGITTLGAMCWSEEGDSLEETSQEWMELVPEHSWTDFFPHLVVSEPQHLDQIEPMSKEGMNSFKVYTAGIEGFFGGSKDGYLLEVSRKVSNCDGRATILAHCENEDINNLEIERLRKQFPDSTSLQHIRESRPDIGEAEAIQRMGSIAQEAGVPIYFVHVTSKKGMRVAEEIKRDYPQAYVESLCDHLSVTVETSNPLKGVQVPPLRTSQSVDSLWEAVKRDKLDVFSTDHVTFTREDKNIASGNVWEIKPSYQKVEYHLPALLHYGYHEREIPLETIVDRTTRRPAEIFGLYPKKGTLLPGSDADLTLVDLDKEQTVDGSTSLSIGDFTVWDGQKLKGWPITTVKGGEVVIEQQEPVSTNPTGAFLKRPLKS